MNKEESVSGKEGLMEKFRTRKAKIAGALVGAAMTLDVGALALGVKDAKATENVKTTSITEHIQEPVIGEAWASFNSPFVDVFENTPYYEAIVNLYNVGIINGYEPKGINKDVLEYRPNSIVTRAQFAKILAKTYGLSVTEGETSGFTDVAKSGSESLYPDNYIAAVTEKDLMGGKSETEFRPNDNVTIEEAILDVVKAADLKYASLQEAPDNYEVGFKDGKTSSELIKKAAFNSLLNNIDTSELLLDQGLKREVAAQIFYNFLNLHPDKPWLLMEEDMSLIEIEPFIKDGFLSLFESMEDKLGKQVETIKHINVQDPSELVRENFRFYLVKTSDGQGYFETNPGNSGIMPELEKLNVEFSSVKTEDGYKAVINLGQIHSGTETYPLLSFNLGEDTSFNDHEARIQELINEISTKDDYNEAELKLTDSVLSLLRKSNELEIFNYGVVLRYDRSNVKQGQSMDHIINAL